MAAWLGAAALAGGQDLGERATADTAASVRFVVEPGGHVEPMLVVDAAGGVDLTHGVVLLVRPVAYVGNDRWNAKLYQALLRIERGDAIRWRVDSGYIASPIGIATFDARPDVNPTLVPPFVHGAALGALETGVPPVQLLAPAYPLGMHLAASTPRWDARVAVTESSAARSGGAFLNDGPARAPQLTVGGGLTASPGLRVGAAWSAGSYAQPSETADRRARGASFTNLEVDWTGGYGRVYGEWVRGSFERAGARGIANAFSVTGVRTLTPRWFVASRLQSVRSPRPLEDDSGDSGGYVHHDYGYAGAYAADQSGDPYGGGQEYVPATRRGWSSEATLAFRVSPELTLRAGYIGYRPTGGISWQHEGGLSITWARRWR
jgi:hypothetical protein